MSEPTSGEPGSPTSYEPPATPAPGAAITPLAPADERNWAVGAHLSSLATMFLGFLCFLGPLTVLLVAGNRSTFVRRHAIEALNFNISVLIYGVISAILVIVLIGFLLLPALFVLWVVTTVLGSLAASRGDEFRYPLSIRFVS